MGFIDIVDVPEKAAKVPELAEDIQAVVDSGKAGAAVVSSDEVVKTIRKIHAAARHIGHGARIQERNDLEDGQTEIVFTVGDRVERKRRTDAE